MRFNSNRQFIHYSEAGMCYYFYFVDNCIYLRQSKDDYIYSDEKIDDNILDYSLAIDKLGVIHLVSINIYGDLKYSIYKREQWSGKYLTKYNANSYQFKNLKIFVVNRKIHILIALANVINSELWTIKHHFWNEKIWSNKKVCDLVIEKYSSPYEADMDANNNIHIVFKSLSEKKYQLYYCRYLADYNVWNLPIRMSSDFQDISYPFILCDDISGAHLVWSSFTKNNMKSFYSFNERVDSSISQWSEPQEITIENGNQTYPIVLQINDRIKVIWKQDNKFYYKSKNILENHWSQIREVNLSKDIKLKPISIIGKKYKDAHFIKAPLAHGFVEDMPYLVGLDIDLYADKKATLDKKNIPEEKKEINNDSNDESVNLPETHNEIIENQHENNDRLEKKEMEAIISHNEEIYNLLLKIQEEQNLTNERLQVIQEILKDMSEKCPCCDKSLLSKLKVFFS